MFQGLKNGSELKEDHVLCSNLGQLGALSSVALGTTDVSLHRILLATLPHAVEGYFFTGCI